MKVKTTSFKNESKATCFIWFTVRWLVWLRRLHGNWQRAAQIPRILQWLLAGLMLIIGLAVGILGAKLALVGGTLYFALMGVVMVIAAVLIFRNRRGGILLYAVAFIASVIWAISDAGWNYWPLFSRLFALGVLAFWPPWSGLSSPAHRRKKARPMASPPFSPWRWR